MTQITNSTGKVKLKQLPAFNSLSLPRTVRKPLVWETSHHTHTCLEDPDKDSLLQFIGKPPSNSFQIFSWLCDVWLYGLCDVWPEAKPRGSFDYGRRGCLRGSTHIPGSVDLRFLWTACRKSSGGGVEAYRELCFPNPSGLVNFPERIQFRFTLISQFQSSVTEACNCQHGYQRSYASKG